MLVNDINNIMKEHFSRTTLIWIIRMQAPNRAGLVPVQGWPLTALNKWVFTDVFNNTRLSDPLENNVRSSVEIHAKKTFENPSEVNDVHEKGTKLCSEVKENLTVRHTVSLGGKVLKH